MILLGRPSQNDLQAEALIKEARRLRRRRWGIALGVIIVVLFGLLAVELTGGFGGGRRLAPSIGADRPGVPVTAGVSKVSLRTAVLPASDAYSEMTIVSGRLVVYGQLDNNTCEEATLDPSTLRLAASRAFNCSFWPPGHDVYLAQATNPRPNDSDINLRLDVIDAKSGRATLGPVVMTSGNASNTRFEDVYGDGSLWIYACHTPSGAELLRVSDTTGAVESRIAMPSICEAVIAAGANGFWMAQSPASLTSGESGGLYHVVPGARVPQLVDATNSSANWIVVSGADTFIDLFTPYRVACRCQRGQLLRYDGDDPTPRFHVSDGGLFSRGSGEYATAVGNANAGIWTTIESDAKSPSATNAKEAIVRVNPMTGRWSGAAVLTPTNADPAYAIGLSRNEGAFFDGDFFFFEPAFYNGDRSMIVRVTS